MIQYTQATLLPVGKEITHRGKSLELVREIGEGFTSVVYEGKLWSLDRSESARVAVKALKPLDSKEAEQNFHEEVNTLQAFEVLEKEEKLKIAPIFHGRGAYEHKEREDVKKTHYIVMEFIEGTPLPDLLAKKEHFLEKDALTIAWQFYRTLDILHTELKKTYIDLKLENLWWVDGGPGVEGQLKVTDLGNLAEIKPEKGAEGIQRDLLLGAIILLYVLTGYPLRYSVHGLQERAWPILERYRSMISWGTWQILRISLHQNPTRRFSSAEEVMGEVRFLADCWQDQDERVYQNASSNYESSRVEQDLERARRQAQRARAALDVLERRSPEFQPEEVRQLSTGVEKLRSQIDYLPIGRDFFMGASWESAYKQFNEGKEWSEDPAVLRRWAYLARAMMGNRIPREEFEAKRARTIEALEIMNQGRWSEARDIFSELQAYLNREDVQALIADCDLYENLKKAEKAKENGQFEDAAKAYGLVESALNRLPEADQDFVQEEEIGEDVASLKKEMERLAGTRGAASRLAKQAVEAAQIYAFDRSIEYFQQALDSDPEYPTLAEELVKASEIAFKTNDVSAAYRILATGIRSRVASEQLRRPWQAAYALNRARQAREKKAYDWFSMHIQEVLTEHKDNNPAVETAKQMVLEFAEIAEENRQADLLEQAAGLMARIPSIESGRVEMVEMTAKKIRDEQDRGLKDIVDKLSVEATAALSSWEIFRLDIEAPVMKSDHMKELRGNTDRLNRARQWIEDATRIDRYLNYKGEEISRLAVRIDKALEEATNKGKQSQDVLDQYRQQQRDALKNRWKEFQDSYDWYQKGKNKAAAEVPEVKKSIIDQLAKDLVEIERQTHEYQRGADKDDPLVREILEQLKNQPLELKMRIPTFTERVEIQESTHKAVEVEPEGSGGFLSPKDEKFIAWAEENKSKLALGKPDPQINKKIREFINQKIPPMMWQNTIVDRYLLDAIEVKKNEIRNAIQHTPKTIETRGFINPIRDWVELEMLIKKAFKQ